jgi:acyl carrier protein
MSDKVIQDLQALIIKELNVNPDGINADTTLFEGGLDLDSFAVVDLVARIEAHYSIQLKDQDFRPENFADIRTLGSVIATYLGDKAQA